MERNGRLTGEVDSQGVGCWYHLPCLRRRLRSVFGWWMSLWDSNCQSRPRDLYLGRNSAAALPELRQPLAACGSVVDHGQDQSGAGQLLQLGHCLRGHATRVRQYRVGCLRFRWTRSCTWDTLSSRPLTIDGGMHGSTSTPDRV